MSSNKKPFEDVVKDANNDSMMKDTVSKKNTDEENSASAVSNQKKDFDMKIEERSTNSDDIDHRVLYGNDMAKPSTSSCFMDITMTDSQANDKLQRKQEWKTDQNVLLIDGKGDTESNNSLALSVGSRVEAKDFEEMWYPAHIVELDYDEMEVLVHYDNSSKKYDEWINVSSPRLRPWTSITESLTKEQVHKERDSEQVTKEKDGQQPKRDTDIEKIKQQKDEIEEKTEDKLILRFKVGERCLARWKDNRRFLATVVKDLGNGKYEIIFDDGFPWTCSVSRLVKVKPHTDVSNVSSSPFDKSEPSPNLSNLNVSSGGECIPTSSPAPNVPAASVPYHKHLFDPTRDYLGPKSERREMKRKLNIKDLFNIGTTKRRRTKVVDQTRKKQLELKEMLERKKKRKARRRGPVKNTAQNDVNKKIDLIKVEQGEETVSENTLTDAASTTSDTSSKIATDTSSKIDILPIKKEESSKATKRKENKNEDNLLVMPDVCMKMNLPKKDDTLIDTENKLLQEVKSEDVQSALITLEDIKNVDVKKGKDDIEKGIVKLKDTFEEKEENKVDIKKEDKMKENASCEGNDKILSSKNWKLKRSRLKKARKLRLLCENRVKKEVEEVKNQLVEMKRQVEEMKKQVRMKSVEALSENNKQEVSESKEQPEVNEVPNTKKQPEPRQLLPGEWCCKWVNGHPQGIVSEVGCDVKVVGSSKAVLPRRSVQVEDDRLPSGWTKHLVRRSFGSSAGQWNVVLVSPENKRFHTKAEVKTYIQVKKDESLKEYERGLFDFGTHRRLSRKIGWDVITCKLPAVPLPSKTVSASSPIVSKKTIVKHRGRGRRDKLESQNKIKKSLEKKSKMFINQSTSKRAVNAISKLEVEKLPSGLTSSNKVVNEDGCVYVGSLKVQIIDNLLRCPAEGCFKNFRNTTLLQMHIKHYHRDLRKSMGVTPKVLDLAYARTLPMETDKSKLKPEAEHKTPKPRMSKPKKPEHEPNIESKDFKEETTVESTPPTPIVEPEKKIPRSLDSPKLRNALTGQPVKRPKVLLPVRKAEMTDEIEAQSPKPESLEDFSESDDKTVEGTEDEEELKSNSEYPTQLDFELEISSHTVTKPVIEREKKKRVKALLPVQKVKPLSVVTSEEDDWCTSDLETRSSYPRSGTPDSRLDKSVDTQSQPTSSEYNEEIKDENMYITETGEKIKIVHMKREEIINCHCGFREEDGLMIQCELCLCWQHALCHNIQRESEVPEKYTCSICLNPRGGRRSQRFLHDQDRLYEGLLPGARPDPALRRAHELSGNLLRFTDALHALRVKYYVATKKNHPKLYLWAKDWENGDISNSSEAKLNSDYLHLSNVITDIGKENLPIRTEDLKNIPLMETRTPSIEEDVQRREGQLVTQLTSLLSSPSGPSLDIPISTTELEHLAKSVQEYGAVGTAASTGPQPEAAIEDGACRERLLRHVQRCQALIDARLDSIEAQVAELESQDPSFEDDETADYFPRTKQTIQMLLRDMDNMEELGFIS